MTSVTGVRGGTRPRTAALVGYALRTRVTFGVEVIRKALKGTLDGETAQRAVGRREKVGWAITCPMMQQV